MQPPDSQWVEVRSSNGHLLFKFHLLKNIIEHKDGSTIYTVDLDEQTVSERPAAAKPRQRWPNNLGRMAY